ncbi:hypothetical protein PV382_15400 [Streptomyces scabiei]|uniref:hypothetical protein n=1 Tax=Streptomyces scabiei TaxID=1930 RepID=UPI0029ACC97F|nr:hypothetical protein [Streptomyces scabiei]MDX2994106.1 hypothetical protein [Streptomyces scabiei]MDX3029082.1 hypothetical protein [Streptomyces scabiei]MDX3047625.1 hypothetical protein [Streptomyces scabiei]MDX3173672.1 hypothetical protein [Streptomyces scabiei]
MTTTFLFDEYASSIRDHAMTLTGQTVSVNLVGGQTLTGTLTYTSTPAAYPVGGIAWPTVLTVTVATKVHKVRIDHVSSLGQG